MIRVLIVEDDKLARRAIVTFFPWREHGMQVVADVNNGQKALEVLHTQPIDLLITDLEMPLMNGIELMREAAAKYPHVAVVVLSVHKDFEYVQEALRLGAIDYIAKIDMQEDQYAQVLERIRQRMQSRFADSERRPEPEDDSLLSRQRYKRDIIQCVNRAVEMMRSDLSAPWYASDVSKYLNISRSYFNQCFKDVMGATFNDYLRQLRVEKAKEYLLVTDDTVEQIALKVGYADEKYFSRVFRESTGFLPSKFRAQR